MRHVLLSRYINDMNRTAALVLLVWISMCGASKLCFFVFLFFFVLFFFCFFVFCFIFWHPQSFLAWKLASETLPTGWIHYYFSGGTNCRRKLSSGQIVTTYDDLRVTLPNAILVSQKIISSKCNLCSSCALIMYTCQLTCNKEVVPKTYIKCTYR